MKNYFTDKLKKSKESINKLEKIIIDAALGLNMEILVKSPAILLDLRYKHSELTKDCAKYCTIDELIELSDLKDYYSSDSLNLINSKDIEYYFKYESQGISTIERDKLIARFGYSLKEAKVK